MNKGKLSLNRFNGIEEFQISEAEIYAWEEEGKIALNLEISADTPLSTLPDTQGLRASPGAEVTIYLESLNPNKLIGRTFIVKHGMNLKTEEWDSRIYYCEHEELNENIIEFISKSNNSFQVKWSGITKDVNFYDGSKPETRVLIEAMFNFGDVHKWQG